MDDEEFWYQIQSDILGKRYLTQKLPCYSCVKVFCARRVFTHHWSAVVLSSLLEDSFDDEVFSLWKDSCWLTTTKVNISKLDYTNPCNLASSILPVVDPAVSPSSLQTDPSLTLTPRNLLYSFPVLHQQAFIDNNLGTNFGQGIQSPQLLLYQNQQLPSNFGLQNCAYNCPSLVLQPNLQDSFTSTTQQPLFNLQSSSNNNHLIPNNFSQSINSNRRKHRTSSSSGDDVSIQVEVLSIQDKINNNSSFALIACEGHLTAAGLGLSQSSSTTSSSCTSNTSSSLMSRPTKRAKTHRSLSPR